MWTGFYGGLNIGGGWDANGGQSGASAYYDPNISIGANPFPAVGPNLFFLPNGNTLGSAGGVVGGAQVGYNFQFNQFVLGVETDFQGTSISGGGNNADASSSRPPITIRVRQLPDPREPRGSANASLSWFGTVRGRAGYLITPTLLLYGTGGFAYGQVDALALATPPPAGPPAAASSGCSRRIGRRRSNISMSISPATNRAATRLQHSARASIRRSTSCALA